jgi:hypothetical protein
MPRNRIEHLPDLGSLPLTVLDLTSNRLTGPIPSFVYEDVIREVMMGDNELSAQLSPRISRMTGLRIFIVSGNSLLTGEVPTLYALKRLYIFYADGTGVTEKRPDSKLLHWYGMTNAGTSSRICHS